MSQSWAKEQSKLRRKAKKNPPPPPNQQLSAPISYARLEHLQTIARNENMEGPDTKLPFEVKDELTEEWMMMVEETFTRFDNNLKCGHCQQRHDCQGLETVLRDLRKEMEGADVEEIDEEAIERFQAKFEEIWEEYLEEIDGTTCGEVGE